MAMYYVSTVEELDGDYLVHRDGCPYMPQGRKWLGDFDTCHAPVERARQKQITANGCPHCAAECRRN